MLNQKKSSNVIIMIFASFYKQIKICFKLPLVLCKSRSVATKILKRSLLILAVEHMPDSPVSLASITIHIELIIYYKNLSMVWPLHQNLISERESTLLALEALRCESTTPTDRNRIFTTLLPSNKREIYTIRILVFLS